MTFPLIDLDVLIDILRGNLLALGIFHALLNEEPLTISAVSRVETIRGCLNRETQQQAERLLKQLELVGLDAQISAKADQLMTKYYLSNNMAVQDALIAATALVYGLPLLTKNRRNFRFIPGLVLSPYPTA